jgi:hypothetical protein
VDRGYHCVRCYHRVQGLTQDRGAVTVYRVCHRIQRLSQGHQVATVDRGLSQGIGDVIEYRDRHRMQGLPQGIEIATGYRESHSVLRLS